MSFWKKLFGGREPAEDQPTATLANRRQDIRLALYIFNSDEISNRVSQAYGQFAALEVYRTLPKALEPETGWRLQIPVRKNIPEAIAVLANWLKAGAHDIDVTRFDPNTLERLESGENLGYSPCVVGVEMFHKSHALSVHQGLKLRHIIGYMGLVTLNKEAPSTADLAGGTEVNVPYDMIWTSRLF